MKSSNIREPTPKSSTKKYSKINKKDMMEECDNIVNGGIKMVVLAALAEFMSPLIWFFVLALVIAPLDTKWGIAAARRNGEHVCVGRAITKTLNKMVNFACWIVLAGALGKVLEPICRPYFIHIAALALIYIREINSCYRNYFVSKGEKNIPRISIAKVLNIFRSKADIIEMDEDKTEGK